MAGIPILIDESRSVFRKRDYLEGAATGPPPGGRRRAAQRLAAAVDRALPSLSRNVGSEENFRRLLELARADADDGSSVRVLVVGGSTEAPGSTRW